MLRRAKTLTEQAADTIRARIIGGELPLGAPLSENQLASELGVSKTPIREALLQLKVEGLVSIQPQRGSFVFDMSPADIAELGELRETLELAALRLAMARQPEPLLSDLGTSLAAMERAVADDDFAAYAKDDAQFHDQLLQHCGNQYLLDCYRSFAFRVDALRTHLSGDPVLNRRSLEEHREIVNEIASGDVDRAIGALKRHAQGTIWEFNASRGHHDAA